jgi:single-strand DNA-binding protein
MRMTFAVGRLVSDPELRQTSGGKSVCEFRLAADGFGKDDTEFFRCVVWEKTAEVVAKYLEKGSQCSVTGRIKTRTWEDKDGNKRYTPELIVDQVKFMGSRGDSDEKGGLL